MGKKYPAITIWQPWATLIAEGVKPFEFRSWPAPLRLIGKRVAIHAGARPVRKSEIKELILKLRGQAPGETGLLPAALPILERMLPTPGALPLSAIVCIATLGQPIRDAELEQRMGVPHINDSDRDEHSNWGWPLSDVMRLEPFQPARGAQGWWTWTAPDGVTCGG